MKNRLWKYSLCLIVLLAVIVNVSGCGSDEIRVDLDEEFTLSAGQHGVVNGENLAIKFNKVNEDSRCPYNVTCVWAGRVACEIELIRSAQSDRMLLTEPGLTDEYSIDTYKEYQLAFHVIPYPEAEKEISPEAYRLHLIISKLPQLSGILGSVIEAPQSYAGKSIIVVGYYRGWDLLHEVNLTPPVTRSDWVVKDATGAIYVNANSKARLPEGLLPGSPETNDIILEIKCIIRVTENGQPYIDATHIERIP